MSYRILIKEPAKRQIDRLDRSVRLRIYKALSRLAGFPHVGKPLRGPLVNYWSYRTGDWRIIYEIHEQVITVIVVAVGHRREVYQAIKEILKTL